MVRELLQCQHARVQTEAVFADFLQLSSAACRQYQLTANLCQLIGHMLSYPTWRTSYPRHLTLQNICNSVNVQLSANADGPARRGTSRPIAHHVVHTKLDAECDEQMMVVGRLSTALGYVRRRQMLTTTDRRRSLVYGIQWRWTCSSESCRRPKFRISPRGQHP